MVDGKEWGGFVPFLQSMLHIRCDNVSANAPATKAMRAKVSA